MDIDQSQPHHKAQMEKLPWESRLLLIHLLTTPFFFVLIPTLLFKSPVEFHVGNLRKLCNISLSIKLLIGKEKSYMFVS